MQMLVYEFMSNGTLRDQLSGIFFSYTSQWNLLFLALGVKIAIKKIATVDIIFLATVF